MSLRHFLQLKDLDRDELDHVFARTGWIKDRFKRYERYWPLQDRTLVMIFEKASTRTRLSFEAGMQQLGGTAIYLNTRDSQLGRGEPVEDAAQVISRMSDIVMIRTYEQEIIERFAGHSRVPVVNGLTNEYHPCQILADIYTFIEHRGPIQGRTVAWIGDSNNVCNTWLQAAEVFGFKVHVSTPPGYEVEPERAGLHGTAHFEEFADPMDAARGADLVTTDVWTSMGFEAENEERMKAFADWQVDGDMMKAAKSDALFMHCLPAHRGEEVAAEVIDGPHSVVWDEAENRLHVQKALMEFLLLGRVSPLKRLLAILAFPLAASALGAEDARQLVTMPAPAQAAVREEMLDFMGALNEIVARLGEGKLADAAAVADAKLGFAAMGRHRTSPPEAMPGRHMPATMHEMGRTLHRLADEFARTARKGDLPAAVAALQPVTANCVACHLSYRIR